MTRYDPLVRLLRVLFFLGIYAVVVVGYAWVLRSMWEHLMGEDPGPLVAAVLALAVLTLTRMPREAPTTEHTPIQDAGTGILTAGAIARPNHNPKEN